MFYLELGGRSPLCRLHVWVFLGPCSFVSCVMEGLVCCLAFLVLVVGRFVGFLVMFELVSFGSFRLLVLRLFVFGF